MEEKNNYKETAKIFKRRRAPCRSIPAPTRLRNRKCDAARRRKCARKQRYKICLIDNNTRIILQFMKRGLLASVFICAALAPAPLYKNFVLIIGPRYSDDFSGIFQTETLPAHLSDSAFNRTLLPYFRDLDDKSDAPELVVKGFIDIIVGNLLDHYEKVPATPTPNIGIIVAALNFIDDHYREPITLEQISGVFGYNKYYFSRLFNTYIGESLNGYINAVRIRNLVAEAKKQENPNLSELVFANGFDSMTTFYRNFSKYYDRPPTEVFRSR